MKETYTILCPQMSPIHFDLIEPAFRASGYKIEVLPNDNRDAVNVGLKYVNNDACYPSLMVVGQIMDAILSGKYDTDHLGGDYFPDGRRLPCFKLHRIYPPGAEKKRDMPISRLFPST